MQKKYRVKEDAIVSLAGFGTVQLAHLNNDAIIELIQKVPQIATYFEEIPSDADPVVKNRIAAQPPIK